MEWWDKILYFFKITLAALQKTGDMEVRVESILHYPTRDNCSLDWSGAVKMVKFLDIF